LQVDDGDIGALLSEFRQTFHAISSFSHHFEAAHWL
jgi:hypothetical protein